MLVQTNEVSTKPAPIQREISRYKGSNNSATERDMARLTPHSLKDIKSHRDRGGVIQSDRLGEMLHPEEDMFMLLL
jgi:hypothetical protein